MTIWSTSERRLDWSGALRGSEFVDLAKKLCVKERPACLRSAVSRAYYGLFGEMIQFYRKNRVGFAPNPDNHLKLRASLRQCKGEEFVDLAQQLGDLHAYRKEADYDLEKLGMENPLACKGIVEDADRALAKFRQLRDASVAGVKAYLDMRDKGLPMRTD